MYFVVVHVYPLSLGRAEIKKNGDGRSGTGIPCYS